MGLFEPLRRPAAVRRQHTRLMQKRSVKDLTPAQLRGRRIVVRVDFNVPFDAAGAVSDESAVGSSVAFGTLHAAHSSSDAIPRRNRIPIVAILSAAHR